MIRGVSHDDAAADQQVFTRAAVKHVDADAADQNILSEAADEGVGSGAAEKAVGLGVADQLVGTGAAEDVFDARNHPEQASAYRARPSFRQGDVDGVRPGSVVERVGAFLAADRAADATALEDE